jgi:hypothetical protein
LCVVWGTSRSLSSDSGGEPVVDDIRHW